MPTKLASSLSLLFALATFGVGGCSAPSDDTGLGSDEGNATSAGEISEVFVSISDLESSTTHTAKVATIKYAGNHQPEKVTRCHQYWLWNQSRAHAVVCRDGKHEIVVDAEYGADPRWARVRTPNGRDVTMTCRQVSQQEFSPETYGGVGGHLCKPDANVTDGAKAFFAMMDGDPTVDQFPTRSQYLPTMWKKSPAESWVSDWKPKVARALPVGEYVGYGSTSAKKCKVKVSADGDDLKVAIYSLTEAGAENRLQGQLVLSTAMTYGGFTKADLPQQVSSATRPASVLIMSAETETATTEYYARNLRVVRFPDAPASVEAGQSAVYIDDNYCQRLEPRIAAW